MRNPISSQSGGDSSPDWDAIYAARREKARLAIVARGIDALLVTHAANRFYLSGFELFDGQPGESSGLLLICADGRHWLATDPRYADAASRLWPKERILIYKGARQQDLATLFRGKAALVGYESESVSCHELRALRAACRGEPTLVACDGVVENLRVIKEPCEISALRQSFAINHEMFSWLEAGVASGAFAGMTEANLAWNVEKFFRDNGASGLAFPSIVACGANAALPHAIPGETPIPANGSLLVDAGCRAADYCSDQTRSFWLGSSPTPQFAQALDLTKKAQRMAIDIMRPGVPCAEVTAAARKVFEDAGVAEFFTHGLGHGVGLETHEAPSLSLRSEAILKEGMVVTVEPGLYYPEWGGVRWEHTFLVTADGVSAL